MSHIRSCDTVKQGILTFKSLSSGQNYPLPFFSPGKVEQLQNPTALINLDITKWKANLRSMNLVFCIYKWQCNSVQLYYNIIYIYFLFWQKQANKANPFRATIMVSWLLIHLACQNKATIWIILFLGLSHHLLFVSITFPVPQQQWYEEHEDTRWLHLSHGVLKHSFPLPGVSTFGSAALPLNTHVGPCVPHGPPVGTSAGGWNCGAHVEHTYPTA